MKNKIISYLKENPESPAGKIASLLGINYYVLIKLLKEMEKDKIVIKKEDGKVNYWSLR